MGGSITKKDIVNYFLEKKVLLTPDMLDIIDKNFDEIKKVVDENDDIMVLNKDINSNIQKKSINWVEFEKALAMLEKNKGSKLYQTFKEFLGTPEEKPDTRSELQEQEQKKDTNVEIVFSYNKECRTKDIQDFVKYYNSRFRKFEEMLSLRPELNNLLTITRVRQKTRNTDERDEVSIIGMVSDKKITKNGNISLTLEDPTGSINVLVNKNKPELFEEVKDIVLDEVVGVNGVTGRNIIFANNVIWPDVPFTKELKRYKEEIYAVFLSDLHVGCDTFLPKEFDKFLSWIRGELGNEKQKEIAKKVKYVFIAGDLVDGVGIYPGQEEDLIIKDIYKQYEECAKLLSRIPKHIEIIVCPGNHDAMRLSEPQPIFPKDFAAPLMDIPNLTMVSNPGMVNIHKTDDFSGFDVLMYHGYSFDYFVANVESIRNNGGYHSSDRIMKFLLKRRHLAPTHNATLHVADISSDPLIITKIPDFFVTGHIHYSAVASYRNITLICGSCFQRMTPFQQKMGHDPEPGRVPVVNLKTRKVNVLKFGD